LLGGVRVALLDGRQDARDFGHWAQQLGVRPALGRPQPDPTRARGLGPPRASNPVSRQIVVASTDGVDR
jgi:hypothetical protein